MAHIEVRPLVPEDRPWRDAQLRAAWGGPVVARLGVAVDAAALDGLVALVDERPAGLLTYDLQGDEVEVVTIQTDPLTVGLGRALMDDVERVAHTHRARRLWLVTTDGNTRALAFYQRWGMRVAAVHVDGVARSRLVKPTIPLADEHGAPLRDEIELELPLPRAATTG